MPGQTAQAPAGKATAGDERRRSAAPLLKGAAVLGAAAIVSKLLGTLQKIPLQNMAGDKVFGIYNAVYPLYILILTLASAGVPIAVSKFVSERAALGRYDEAKRVFGIAALTLFVSGAVFCAALYLSADGLAAAMGVREAGAAIRSVSFALLVVPVMAALRGYFQGLGDMVPTAVSQVAEQAVRVATMIALLLVYLHIGAADGRIAAGATFGSVAGAASGLAVLLPYWARRGRESEHAGISKPEAGAREPAGRILRQFVLYALPICLGTIVMPMVALVDTFTIPRSLGASGMSEHDAVYAFGVYNRGLPLVQLVSLVATSMSAALVPAIAEAALHGRRELIRVRTELAVRFTWLIGLAASFGLAVAAKPLNVMFFASAEGTFTMATLAFTALFSAVNVVSGSVLQGTGAVAVPARNLLIAAALKLAGNLVLVPLWGIQGAAVSAVVAFAAASALNVAALRRATGARFAVGRDALRPLLACGALCGAVALVLYGGAPLLAAVAPALAPRLQSTLLALVGVAVGAAVYAAALFRAGAVTRRELEAAPGFGARALPWLVRLRLLRP